VRTSGRVLLDHWRLFTSILGGLLLACLLYCLLAPRQYDARAWLALRSTPASALSLETAEATRSRTPGYGDTQLETLANAFRSDQLAWRVILDKKLYEAPGIRDGLAAKFPSFQPASPTPAEEAYLLENFQNALRVRTLPRTSLLELRFRSRDAALSVEVVNDLIRVYQEQETETRILATAQAAGWLNDQLKELKAKAERDEQHMAAFQKAHGLLIAPESGGDGQPGSMQHASALLEVDELGRELVAASAERILREAEFRAASEGDPELVLASDSRLQSESGGISAATFRQIHQRRGDLEQEWAQLAGEHGPNFPRVVEIRQQLDDLDRQLQSEDARLRERFRSAWQTAAAREDMVRKALAERTREGQQANEAAAQFEDMRREADASREVYVSTKAKIEEAGLAAGVDTAGLWVVDPAHVPGKPAVPNVPLYMAIALFAGTWLAAGAVFLVASLRRTRLGSWAAMIVFIGSAVALHGQAPTPSTSGLPTGVVKLPATKDTKNVPNPKEAPPVWNAPGAGSPAAGASTGAPVAGPIVAGEMLDVVEYHTPEFHSTVRVSAAGAVTLPMIGEVYVGGLDENAAARAVAAELMSKGMLLHPQVTVLITLYVGQDVTIMGEVARPGVYPYGVHHRLLDVISAASGLNVTAGGLVNIVHRDDPGTPQMVTLDFSQAGGQQQNPQLLPGDLVQVSRAGLVYVVGDVNRPGGFTLDPAQSTTVLQALSLAWGPSQNASLSKALLIHARDDGRTVTTLNLKRMLRGQDPDIPVGERDILFVPDSTARSLWNRTMESVVQSAAGVSIYAGLVYSQRF
jgi:polysaccharide export outer membrane protein